jgi:hypothetical protein
MSAFEIKLGTIAKLVACDNCDLCDWDEDDDPCDHGRNNHKLVEVVEESPHEDPAMETPCYVVRVLQTGEILDDIRMWDIERPSPLEELAQTAE